MNMTLLYYFHLLLNSKYKLLITVGIYFLIYYLNLKSSSSFAYCMTEESSIPAIAETKEIKTSGSPRSLIKHIEDQSKIIAEQQQCLTQLVQQSKADLFELEKIRVEERIIATTYRTPESILNGIENYKIYHQMDMTHPGFRTLNEQVNYLSSLGLGVSDIKDLKESLYLVRMYSRLTGKAF